MTSPGVVRRLGPDFPKAKSLIEVEEEEKKRAEEAAAKGGKYVPATGELPPVIRSVMELSIQNMSWLSQSGGCTPGGQGGVFYKGKPYCFAFGYRDGTRVIDLEEKGNHMKAKDPLLCNHLSIPAMTALLCQLSDEDVIHFDTPLSQCIPELGDGYDKVTPRDVMSYQAVLDESKILKDCGASSMMASWWMRQNVSDGFEKNVYSPVCKFFNVGASTASGLMLSGKQQRENFVQYLVASKRGTARIPAKHCRPSHFSLALLAACIERRLSQRAASTASSSSSSPPVTSFEDCIKEKLFEPLDCKAAGYGPPKQFRDPNELFYRPSGIASGHHGFKIAVAQGAFANAAPPLLNASLNMYAPAEEVSKILLVSLDCVQNARKTLGHLANMPSYHYDLGVTVNTTTNTLFLRHQLRQCLDCLPYSASFVYDTKNDLASFTLSNSGSRRARLFANVMTRMTHYHFVQNVLLTGSDAEAARDPSKPPDEHVNEAHAELERLKKEKQKIAPKLKAKPHTRF